ncbi:MAG TPA: methyltransferase, TIGR04325 family [Victivallales bacterium]|nr:methyltransferase, TIGR04325 family [Victivallales bacterium]
MIKKLKSFAADCRYYLKFKTNYSGFRGVFTSFEEAIEKSPTKIIGYDNKITVERYLKSFNPNDRKIRETEYPLFFWLNYIIYNEFLFKEEIKIFDFGGNLGGHFFRFLLVAIKKEIKWIVCELQSIATLGKERFSNNNLCFTTSFDEADGCDIFFSSGAIQYVKSFLSLSLD